MNPSLAFAICLSIGKSHTFLYFSFSILKIVIILLTRLFTESICDILCETFWNRVGLIWASQVALVVENFPASAGEVREVGSIPGSGKSLGGGYGNPLQYSCLENPMDRGARWAVVRRVTNSQTRRKQLSMYAYVHRTYINSCFSPLKLFIKLPRNTRD